MSEYSPDSHESADLSRLPITVDNLTIEFTRESPEAQRATVEIAPDPLATYLGMVEATGKDVDGRTIAAALMQFCVGEIMNRFTERTLYGPRVDNSKPPPIVKSGRPFKCEFLIDTPGPVNWPDFAVIELQRPIWDISQTMIDAEVQQQRRMVGSSEPREGAVQAGDRLVCTLKMTAGEDTVLLEQDGVEIDIPLDDTAIVLMGQPMPALAEHLIGQSAGTTVSIDFEIPTNHPNPVLRGKVALLAVEITSAQAVIPATIEVVLESMEIANEAMLRTQIEASLKAKFDRDVREVLTDQFYKALLDRVELNVPEEVVMSAVNREGQAIGQRMAAQGVPHNEIMGQLQQSMPARTDRSRRMAKRGAITKLLIRDFQILTSELNISHYIAGLAADQGRRPEDLRREIMDRGAIPQITARVQEVTCFEWMQEQLTIDNVPLDEWTAQRDGA